MKMAAFFGSPKIENIIQCLSRMFKYKVFIFINNKFYIVILKHFQKVIVISLQWKVKCIIEFTQNLVLNC